MNVSAFEYMHQSVSLIYLFHDIYFFLYQYELYFVIHRYKYFFFNSSENLEKRVSQSEQLLAEDDSFLPCGLQKQDETSSSEPVSPSHKSPVLQSMTSKSLAAFDTPITHPAVSPIGADESLLYKPFSGDLNMCLEDASPKASTPEEKFSHMKPESIPVFQSSIDQQTSAKDTLETIIEGPLESIAEVENVEESYKYINK